jgi:hypothetical protein
VPKSSKLYNKVISPNSSKNFYIADQSLKTVYLKIDSKIFELAELSVFWCDMEVLHNARITK